MSKRTQKKTVPLTRAERLAQRSRTGEVKYQSLTTTGGVDNSILGYCVWWCLTRGRGGEVGEGFRIRKIIIIYGFTLL